MSHSLEKVKVEVYAEPDAKVCIYGTKLLGSFTSHRLVNDLKNKKAGLLNTRKSLDISIHGMFQNTPSSLILRYL